MLDAKALANASSLMALIIYAVCVVLVAIAPDVAFSLLGLTFHGVNLEILRPSVINFDITNLVLGAILWPASVWVVLFGVANFYNTFRKK